MGKLSSSMMSLPKILCESVIASLPAQKQLKVFIKCLMGIIPWCLLQIPTFLFPSIDNINVMDAQTFELGV
jgi:hypothetical protein